MTLQELMQSVNAGGSDRPDIARFSPEEISSRDKDRQETFDAIGRRVLSKFSPPAMMIVRQSSKLAQKGIEKWAKSAKKKGMSETEIWRGAGSTGARRAAGGVDGNVRKCHNWWHNSAQFPTKQL